MGLLIQTLKLGKNHLGTTIKYLTIPARAISKKHTDLTKLAEVGRLESPKLDGRYDTGQLFLHRIFGYRGVILFPWTARVFDRDVHHPQRHQVVKKQKTVDIANSSNGDNLKGDISNSDGSVVEPPRHKGGDSTDSRKQTATPIITAANVDTSSTTSASSEAAGREVKGRIHTFYQVLIDSRDCPYIRAQTEAVTFLGNQESNRSLYAIPGLDYVAHDDIMPYTSGDKHPLHHELFEKFLMHDPEKEPPFEAKDTLRAWQEKNHPWLELSDVHKETTENVRVTVIPFYMGCRETPASSVYWWRYCIRLENLGELSVQLRERHWRIFSLSGTLETVRGRGVVGQEPILSPRLPAFQYSSHVSLQAPSGHMWGTFRLEREDGRSFDCKIPPFSLESKPDDVSSDPENSSDN